jgi:GT2 family glycosyltransferase
MNVSVVIPNWNGEKYLAECLDSIEKQTIKADIVVVENNSTDSSLKILKNYPGIKVLKQDKNLGVAGGFTAGFEYALQNNYDLIALFNNDAVADKNWLNKLVEVLQSDKQVGIATCKLIQYDRIHIDSTGDVYSTRGLPFARGRNETDSGQYDDQTDIFAASGGASLYRTSMMKQIGLFDIDFFAYFEDVDLSFRAQLAGWKVKYVPSAIAYHRLGATSKKLGYFNNYHSIKNFWFVYIKNMPLSLFFKYLPLAIYAYLRIFVSRMLRGGRIAFFKAFIVSIYLTPKMIIKRWGIQKDKTVTSENIDKILYHKKPPSIPTI